MTASLPCVSLSPNGWVQTHGSLHIARELSVKPRAPSLTAGVARPVMPAPMRTAPAPVRTVPAPARTTPAPAVTVPAPVITVTTGASSVPPAAVGGTAMPWKHVAVVSRSTVSAETAPRNLLAVILGKRHWKRTASVS